MSTRCLPSCWLHWQGVSIILDYEYSSRCLHGCWLHGHGVRIILDYEYYCRCSKKWKNGVPKYHLTVPLTLKIHSHLTLPHFPAPHYQFLCFPSHLYPLFSLSIPHLTLIPPSCMYFHFLSSHFPLLSSLFPPPTCLTLPVPPPPSPSPWVT